MSTREKLADLLRTPQSLAYLIQALESFTAAGSARSLYHDLEEPAPSSVVRSIARHYGATHRRLGFLRSTVLFTALAVEACANEFLEDAVSSADAHVLDRLAAPEKLLLGSRLAGFEPVLDRGRQPLQRLIKLAEARNALVHPRRVGPKSIGAFPHNVTARDRDLVGPRAAADYVIAAAQAMVLLEPRRTAAMAGDIAATIVEGRAALDEHVELLGDDIFALPERDSPAPPSLIVQLHRRRTARRRRAKPDA